MNKTQADVLQFHEAFGCVTNDLPTVIDLATAQLRLKLIYEELTELAEALGFHKTPVPSYEHIFMVDVAKLVKMHQNPRETKIEIADALGDLEYVVNGTAVSSGMNLQPIVNEIHRSNMSKVWPDGTVDLREDGKVIKSPEYSPADLGPILDSQGPLRWLTIPEGGIGLKYEHVNDKFQVLNSKGDILVDLGEETREYGTPESGHIVLSNVETEYQAPDTDQTMEVTMTKDNEAGEVTVIDTSSHPRSCICDDCQPF